MPEIIIRFLMISGMFIASLILSNSLTDLMHPGSGVVIFRNKLLNTRRGIDDGSY